MAKLYQVKLTEAERETLQAMISKGSGKAQRLRRARTLLLADAGRADQPIAEALQIGRATVRAHPAPPLSRRVWRRRSAGAPSAGRARERKLDGEKEAHLVALACSVPPEGHARWSLQPLADRLVALQLVDACSYETVRRTLKKRAQAVAIDLQESKVARFSSYFRQQQHFPSTSLLT